jgi:tetratricopeptide (TPR) repeat protein
MDSSRSELIILLVGIAAALSSFHHYFAAEGEKRRSWVFITLLVLSVGTQLGTQGLQYHNAFLTLEEQDRRTSDALYAFNETEDQLLLKVADPRMSDSNAYIIGYWYFKHRSDTAPRAYFDRAKDYLNISIQNKRFVAQSYYLLGTINRLEQKDSTLKDWTAATQDFESALKADDKFAAAYYGRAILRQEGNNLQGALEDIEKATRYSVIACWDARDKQEQNEVWKRIKDLPAYHAIMDECGARYELLPPP